MSRIPKTSLRILSVLLVLVSVPGMFMVPSPMESRSDGSSHAPRSIPNTDVHPIGANFFLEREVEPWKQELTLKMAKEAGIGWIKAQFSWESIEPRKGEFRDTKNMASTWAKYDRLVSLAERYGMRVIARLDRPPAWSRQDNTYPGAPPDRYEDFGDFVAAVVERYKGRIQHYQIWNEPNLGVEWGKDPVDAAAYVRLLSIAYRRAKEVDPNALILSGPLAQTLENSPRNLNELTYLQRMYDAGGGAYFDILFANAYGFDRPPADPPDPNVLNFGRIFLLRQIMERNGDGHKAVWINEYGWNSSPEDFSPKRLLWRRVSEQQQAKYTAQGIELARRQPWIGVINIWYFRQEGRLNPQVDSDYYFRLVDVDFTPRLPYHAIKTLAKDIDVAAPGFHEETSPAVQRNRGWKWLLLPDASGGGALVTETPGDSLSITFEGTHLSIVYWANRTSGRLNVEIDGEDPDFSRRDAAGKSYIDLSAPEDVPVRKQQTVVSGLTPGKHSVTLTLAQPDDPEAVPSRAVIDAFVVENRPRLWPFFALSALGFVGLLGFGTSVFRRRPSERGPVRLVK